MGYKNHTPGGCCCDACFSVSDNFCDMDFNTPPEMTWGAASSYGWTNYQCYAEGSPVLHQWHGLEPDAATPTFGAGNIRKFYDGRYEYDIELKPGGIVTIAQAVSASLPALRIYNQRNGSKKIVLVRYGFNSIGFPEFWALSRYVELPASVQAADRFRVRVFFNGPVSGLIVLPGISFAKVYVRPLPISAASDYEHVLTFFRGPHTGPFAKLSLCNDGLPLELEDRVGAQDLEVVVSEAPANSLPTTEKVKLHNFQWSWTGLPNCPTIDEWDYMTGFRRTDPHPQQLDVTVSGCDHPGLDGTYRVTKQGFGAVHRYYLSADQNWNNTGHITTDLGDFYHSILRQVGLYIGTFGDLRIVFVFGLVFGPTLPTPTNGTRYTMTYRYDIATVGNQSLTAARSVNDAFHITCYPKAADTYGFYLHAQELDNGTVTISLV